MKESVFFCLLISTLTAFSQPGPYRLAWKADLAVTAIAGAGVVWAFYEEREIQPLTPVEVQALNPEDIIAFDRPATKYWSEPVATASDVLLAVSVGSPFMLFAHKRVRQDFPTILVMYGEVLLVNQAITDITKNTALRTRPLAYNPVAPDAEKYKTNARRSYFSGHTSGAAAMSFFGAKVFNDYFPDSRAKPWVWTAAALLPATVGFLRVRAGKHFPTDVITGYAVGAATGFLIPHFHKRRKDSDQQGRLQVFPAGGGLGMVYRF